ncbi:MAG: peptide chain release factor N(5)-glutamine methyltransferase [Phycisphaerae bacterium]
MATPVETTNWTVGKLLAWTADYFSRHHIDEPRLSAELLLAHALGCSRMALYTGYEQIPPAAQVELFRSLVKRRKEHEPVAYLTGRAWFYSLELRVSSDVLIPRPDTETLVEQAITALRNSSSPRPRVLDLCTGSGCAALAIAKNCPATQIVATDISPAALAIAQANALHVGLSDRVVFRQGDLFDALPPDDAPFNLITANPPYIGTGLIDALAPEISRHEPRLALDGGDDGLQIIRRIIEGAPEHLVAGGWLLMETAFDQTQQVSELVMRTGRFEPPRVILDVARNPRCVAARLIGISSAPHAQGA